MKDSHNTPDNEISSNEIKHRLNKRYLSIDVYKGLSIIMMVFVNSIQLFEKIPPWSKHTELYGLTYVDLIFPFFIFMMGLNYTLSFERHLSKEGLKETYIHFLKRFLVYIGLGLALSISYDSEGIYLNWGILQVLGASGLILLPFMRYKWYIKIIPLIFLIIIYSFFINPFFGQMIYDGIEGGLLGTISWTSLLICSTILAEGLQNKDVKTFILGGSVFLTLSGIILSFINPLSRQLVSTSYVILTAGISGLLFYILYYIFEVWGKNRRIGNQENFLSILGKNSFFLFIIHLLLISIVYEIFPLNISVFLVLFLAAVNIVIISLTGYFLYKMDVKISI
jgi:predicted acyltransferase